MFLPLRAASLFALATGMGLITGAHAAEGHEDAHGGGHELVAKSLKPDLKAAAKAMEAKEGGGKEAKGEDKREAKGEGKGEGKSAKAGGANAKEGKDAKESKEGGDKTGAAVSMADLRDLIDQKIAEVRAKQIAAPAVRVVARSPKVKREPVGAMGRAGGHGAEGALLPTAVAMAAAHGAAATSSSDAHGQSIQVQPGSLGQDVHWAYSGDTGPGNWGTLKPEFQTCMLGKRQSPIDIRDGLKVNLEEIIFDYRPTAFRVIDNGHTIQVNVDPGNSIMIQGRRFDLVQFHFHRPSEERINGRQSDMVAHLVHKDAEGKLAVVAVLLDQGDIPHPMIQLVWNSLPLEKNTEQYSPVMMDLNLLLPTQRQYYTYMGSLTTPPCSEGVLWMVMKQPSVMSRDQLNIFSRLYSMNARPIQSASGRIIKEGQ